MSTQEHQRHILTIKEKGIQETYVLEAGMYSVGRDPSCSIVFRSKSISRHHALLLRIPGDAGTGYRYRIKDGDSRGRASANGIRVNDKSCREQDLADGDRIVFGDCIQAHYHINSLAALDVKRDTLKVAEFRSVKAKQQDQFPTLLEAELADALIASVQQINPAEVEGAATIVADCPQLGSVNVEVLVASAVENLNVGDRIRIAQAGSSYILTAKLEGSGPRALTPNMRVDLPQPAHNTELASASISNSTAEQDEVTRIRMTSSPGKNNVHAQPVEMSTVMQELSDVDITQLRSQLSANPKPSTQIASEIANEITTATAGFRDCYAAVLEQLGDLNLSESSYVTIASTIFAKLYP
ncbi:MAG: FHA domain-containing protein [Cyanobacteria bacterium P01_H01_bin.121]